MNSMFTIYLDNGDKYLIEINFNLQMYIIKKGYLYRGFKKLGKIIAIKEGMYTCE